MFVSYVNYINIAVPHNRASLRGVAAPGLMTAADAPIRAAGGYLPLIFGAVFTWATAKALLMERRREQDRNKTVSVDFTRKVRSAA